jgi:hypothetical protein
MYVEQLVPTPKHLTVGEKYHERTETAQVLLDQGFVKQAVPELPPLAITWSVVADELNGIWTLYGRCSRACGNFRYSGDPDYLSRPNFAFFHGCDAQPTMVPSEITQLYRSRREGAVPFAVEKKTTTGFTDALAMANHTAKMIDRQQADAFTRYSGGIREWGENIPASQRPKYVT